MIKSIEKKLVRWAGGAPLALGLVLLVGAPVALEALGVLKVLPPGSEMKRAAETKKPILYVFTAEWCGPCHQLEDSIFADAAKARQLAEWFVVVEVPDTSNEDGSNPPEVNAILRRYRVSTLPTMIVALPDGTEYSRMRGYYGPAGSWRWLEQRAEAGRKKLSQAPSGDSVPAP